jgi:small subunit ribosomal protein S6
MAATKSPGHPVRGEVDPVRKYEIVFILKVDQPESEMATRVERVDQIVGAHGGEVTARNHWGVRRLAYEIQHETKGDYMHIKFQSEGPAVAELDRAFRLDDLVLRHLVVRDEEWEERNREAQARRRSAAAAGAAEEED